MRFASASAITVFYNKSETWDKELTIRESWSIARLMARCMNVRGNVTVQRRNSEILILKVGDFENMTCVRLNNKSQSNIFLT